MKKWNVVGVGLWAIMGLLMLGGSFVGGAYYGIDRTKKEIRQKFLEAFKAGAPSEEVPAETISVNDCQKILELNEETSEEVNCDEPETEPAKKDAESETDNRAPPKSY